MLAQPPPEHLAQEAGQIYFIAGAPGVGKSTTAKAILAHFPRGYHLEVDQIREAVGPGMASSLDPWTDETERQFELAHVAAVHVARTYAQAGFTVVIDHCVNPRRIERVTKLLPEVRPVMLVLNLETNLERNRQRTNKPFDPTALTAIIEGFNHANLADFRAFGWPVVECDGRTSEEIAREILEF